MHKYTITSLLHTYIKTLSRENLPVLLRNVKIILPCQRIIINTRSHIIQSREMQVANKMDERVGCGKFYFTASF